MLKKLSKWNQKESQFKLLEFNIHTIGSAERAPMQSVGKFRSSSDSPPTFVSLKGENKGFRFFIFKDLFYCIFYCTGLC